MLGTTLTVWLIVVVVSMTVAVVIKGLTALLGRGSATAGATSTRAPVAGGPRPAAIGTAGAAGAAPATTGTTPTTSGGHRPEHVAAISAAVAAVFDDSAVVVHIEPVRGASGWTSEGRAAHHTSHNLGRSPRQS